ncbi:50S ribosomal protein L4 [Candidatus Peregrinibacteria bacterium]|nr:50S ribosomal protein L4 [Candidatus Peregrinibacteria bacterium]
MKIPLYLQDGSRKGEIEAPINIFGVKPNKALIHKIFVMQISNRRHPIAHTLTKGEVRGGGKKPYRQKGTGRARQGSTRNPHFRGGGVAFGPRNTRNFRLRAPKKERRLALFGVLAEKLAQGRVCALESFSADPPKTKIFAQMLSKLPFKAKTLFVLPEKNEIATRCSRNLKKVKTLTLNSLNIADLLKYENVVFFKEALTKLKNA